MPKQTVHFTKNCTKTSMPFIRYQVNDRCILHNEKCECGRKGNWIEVIGREIVLFSFVNKEGDIVKVPSPEFELILLEAINEDTHVQMVVKENDLEIRIRTKEKMRDEVFAKINKQIDGIALKNNIELNVRLSCDEPKIEASGKIKSIIY